MSKREFEVVAESPYIQLFKTYTYVLTFTLIGLAFFCRFLDFGQNQTHPWYSRASFLAITLLCLFHCFLSIIVVARQNFPFLHPIIYFFLQTAVSFQSYSSIRGYLRGDLWRYLISYPSAFFSVLLIFSAVGIYTIGKIIPSIFTPKRIIAIMTVVMIFGLAQSVYGSFEVVEIKLGNKWGKTIKVVQLSDIHLGPTMGVSRLTKIAQEVADQNPDLILITGDMYTMESHNELTALSTGLAPLKRFEGKIFACYGNHDHEVPHVGSELKKIGARLLVNEKINVDTKVGKITIIGFDWVQAWSAKEQMEANKHLFSEEDSEYRFILLHNPNYFAHVEQDPKRTNLVFSGHHHGGAVGFTGEFTILRLVAFPDANKWCKNEKGGMMKENGGCVGTDRMYVHRGNGFYGLPLRVGVSSEESLLEIHL
jgi:predicted MPP superfamily phosphohydrolase